MTEVEGATPGGAAGAGYDEAALTALSFYPSRLPVPVGGEGEFVVVLDPGYGGVSGPLHIAYDPARLEVTAVEGGDLPGSDRNLSVAVSHTPALGWITATWSGQAVGSGTLLVLRVAPRAAGELPVIFAGPVGAAVAEPATVVALPASVRPLVPQVPEGS